MVGGNAVRSGFVLSALLRRAGIAFVCAMVVAAFATDAFAQRLPRSKTTEPTLSNQLKKRTTRNPNARMLVTANEMIYDNRQNLVHAVGQVQIYYDGNVLEADKVTYDRKTNRMLAEGNVRYKTKDGNVVNAQSLEMSQDFRDGFVNSMLVETPQRTRFAATRADRSGGELTVYQKGIYTACEPCRDDPRKPPLWQVKATRIIHNEKERKVYYENATFEFFGQPIAYFPWFYHPDPTVKRQSGFLMPKSSSSNRTGFGIEVPYFWSIKPYMDATLALTPYTQQGVLAKAEFRHRVINGAYMIRSAGIFQTDPDKFGLLSGNREFRGMLEATGEFNINKRWIWGFEGALITDRSFMRDYDLEPTGPGRRSERLSQVYLVGQGDRSYFDLRAQHFRGLSELDNNNQIPVVHPVLDYSYYFKNPIVGGELSYKINFTSITREQFDFAPINGGALDPRDKSRCLIASATPADCFIRGFAGDYSRLSAQADWRRTITTRAGILFTPFARVRADVASFGVTADAVATGYGLQEGREELVRAMPAVGFETRWPFISVHSWGTQTVEPIVQAIFRPNETQIGRFPNEDAQSLVFDDTNLFAIDKYSGYDRVEGGSRLNYGVQYSANVHRFGLVNVLFGQSYQMFGRNSFAYSGTLDRTGTQIGGYTLESGLEDRASDYVARVYFQPTGRFSFISRFRFDRDDFSINRFEFESTSRWNRLRLSTIYSIYEAQPLIGYLDRREALYQTASYQIHDFWRLTGAVRYNIESGKVDFGAFGIAYADECFIVSANYIVDYTNVLTSTPVHRYVLRVNLRSLGADSQNPPLR